MSAQPDTKPIRPQPEGPRAARHRMPLLWRLLALALLVLGLLLVLFVLWARDRMRLDLGPEREDAAPAAGPDRVPAPREF